MACFCLTNLNEFLAGLEIQIPALQMDFLPALPPIPTLPELPLLPQLAAMSSGLPTFDSAMNATFPEIPSGLSMPSLPGLNALEALAALASLLGVTPFGLPAIPEFSLAAGSLNMCTPALEELLGMLQPLIPPLAGLAPIAFTMEAVQTSFGINLAAPQAIPELNLALSQMAMGLPAVTPPALAANLAIAPDLSALARLFNAASALGFDLSLPGGMEGFGIALESMPALAPPEFTLPIPSWLELINALTALEATTSAFGINPFEPGAPAAMAAGMGTLEMNLQALEANLQMSLGLPVELSVPLDLALNVGLQMEGAMPSLGMDFSALTLPAMEALPLSLPSAEMPTLNPMALASTFSDLFQSVSGMPFLSSIPCPNVFCIAGRF